MWRTSYIFVSYRFLQGGVLGHSGVTVGGGVDLGSKSRSYFTRIGVCSPLISKLEPYFGKQGASADQYLQSHPLQLSQSEASYLTDKVMSAIVQRIESSYNSAIGKTISIIHIAVHKLYMYLGSRFFKMSVIQHVHVKALKRFYCYLPTMYSLKGCTCNA